MPDEILAQAIALLQQHEKSKAACLAFLRRQGESPADPIALKLWVADRLATPPAESVTDERKP